MVANSARVMLPSGSKFPSDLPSMMPRAAKASMAVIWSLKAMSGKVLPGDVIGWAVTAGSLPSKPCPCPLISVSTASGMERASDMR